MQNIEILKKIELLGMSFEKILHEEDEFFMENMKNNSLANDDINKYKFWEWTQGVGLYGFWKLFEFTKNEKYLNLLTKYYDERLKEGLPSKNVNTVAPMLALAFVYEHTKNEEYLTTCVEWAEWIMNNFPRTIEGGFQHITSDSLNPEELWDDTLFMTVMFLAKMGMILDKQEYINEAEYQFLLHAKYLADKKTGLWYHGWTFLEENNFAGAFWGRGNSWITIAIPEFIELINLSPSVERYLIESLKQQIDALLKHQNENGMWHTLIDDDTSYIESSATAGFAFGMLKSIRKGYIDESYLDSALKATKKLIEYIDADGVVQQVSYGTPMGRESKDFYKEIPIQPMPYGQAMTMLLLIEYLNH